MISFPLWRENWHKPGDVLLFYTWDVATVKPGFRIYSSTTEILQGFKFTIKSILSQNGVDEVKQRQTLSPKCCIGLWGYVIMKLLRVVFNNICKITRKKIKPFYKKTK